MRIIAIVGMPESGKTATAAALMEAIRRRGKKAGVCKTIINPMFTLGESISDTMRHRRAGSELVCTRAKGETAFLYPEALPLSKVLERFKDCDYVLLEGDYFAPVPRIVCAHQEEDALLRMNTRTFAFSGHISEKTETALPLPCFNALTDADSLLDVIDKRIPNIMPCTLLDQLLPPVSGVMDDGFSQPSDHAQSETDQAESLQVIFKGKNIQLTSEQRETLIGWIQESQNNP